MTDDIVANYAALFRGRIDCYGSWGGGCVKAPVTEQIFAKHLTTGPHVGVYPLIVVNDVAHCWWGCTDIDYSDYDEARRLQDAFAAVDVRAWTERTRKGWHIWVFADTAVPAEAMRHMFLACHRVARSRPTEVNPKQTHLKNGAVGNYVRLPYPAGDAATERYISEDGRRLTVSEFVAEATACRATAQQIADLADYYTPPTPPMAVLAAHRCHDMTAAASSLTPLGRVIFRSGPIAGKGDRSTTLARLAYQCYESGISAGDALALLEDADYRWGKFMHRGEAGRLELIKLVQLAYGARVTVATSQGNP